MVTKFCHPSGSANAGDSRKLPTGNTADDGEVACNAQATFNSELASAWVERLRERSRRLAQTGIQYLHLPVPDNSTVQAFSREPEPAAQTSSALGYFAVAAGHKSPSILNALPYFVRQSALYPLYGHTDPRWSFSGCYSAYQLLCSRLDVPTNRALPGYPHSETEYTLEAGFDPANPAIPATEKVRTYQLDQRVERIWANSLVRFLEEQGQTDNLKAHPGAHVIYRNSQADAVDQTLVLFGSTLSDYRPRLLTGMLAETFREVHFIGSDHVDFDYVARVNASVVITECPEHSMLSVPEDTVAVSALGSEALANLKEGLAPDILPAAKLAAQNLGPASAAGTRTLILPPEQYALDAPMMVQPGCDASERDTAMKTNTVSLIELRNAKIFFDGAACLVRDANDAIVYRYGLNDEQCENLLAADYPELPGLTHLLGASMGAHCYYHWIVDILPRLGVLQKAGVPLDSLDNILVREAHRSFQAETLERLGIHLHQVLETRKNSHFTCKRLLHVTLDNGINMKMNRFVPAWLQHNFGAPASVDERIKLYISRPAGVRRGIANEAELIPLLEANGFMVTTMEGKSVKQQAELLSRANVLMSPHGGALTNMIFCRPGIKVIELFGRHVYPFYYGLAQSCGHEYHAILEDAVDFNRLIQFSAASAVGSATFQKQTRENSFCVSPDLVSQVIDDL